MADTSEYMITAMCINVYDIMITEHRVRANINSVITFMITETLTLNITYVAIESYNRVNTYM